MNMLTTPRLIIRKPTLSDFDNLYRLQSNTDVMSFIGDGKRNKEEVTVGLEKAINHYKKHNFSLGCVYLKNSNEFIGRAGVIYLNYDDNQPDIELAYAILPKYWGKGYATELTKSLIHWAFESLSIQKIIAVVHPENNASQNVLIKSGMINSGTMTYWNKEILRFEIINPRCTI
ncbi:GNAT family N-acetyltransferase [Fluoribacter dumoffii]|uniref:GNAT family N-acetyltransferase n=1 Tax=Fluoribacter dumoffii TaxID=463 RepID=UPI00026C770B|nr:GNAT family N-acetyltransferase [Fluoribacter dumoffii]